MDGFEKENNEAASSKVTYFQELVESQARKRQPQQASIRATKGGSTAKRNTARRYPGLSQVTEENLDTELAAATSKASDDSTVRNDGKGE